MRPFYTWCACRRAIGDTDGAVLRVGAMEVRKATTFWCPTCGQATNWRPVVRDSRVGIEIERAPERAPEQIKL